jgi:hypothetical protein
VRNPAGDAIQIPIQEGNSMKHWIGSSAAVATLVLMLCLPVAVPAAPAPKAPQPRPAAAPAPEPHPEIRQAIAALRRARAHLNNAAHDFGGHRVEAIKATDEAIRQLQICLQYDR